MGSNTWMFTLWKSEEQDEQLFITYAETFFDQEKLSIVRFACYQVERGHQSQRLHIQGYMELNKKMRLNAVKKELFPSNPSVNLQQRRGTREEARDYCMKNDTRIAGPWEIGKWEAGGRGARTDLQAIGEIILEEKLTIEDAMERWPGKFMQYRSGMTALCHQATKKRQRRYRQVKLIVLYGEPGTGKTRWANKDADSYIIPPQNDNGRCPWFDGYGGESAIILDDFYGASMSWTNLLKITEGYRIQVQIKGGFIYANYETVYITSNVHPKEWYAYDEKMRWGALKRRIYKCIYFDKEGNVWNEELPDVLDPFEWTIEARDARMRQIGRSQIFPERTIHSDTEPEDYVSDSE